MPDTYMLVGISEAHGHQIFKGDLKRMEEHRRMVAEGFWGYFATVNTLDGPESAMQILRFCIRKHGLNSALITFAPAKKRSLAVDAEIDRLLLTSKKKTPYLLKITNEPCDLERVRRFRSGATLTADGSLKHW